MLAGRWCAALALVASAACGFVDAGAKPVVEAHRFGATEAPQNSHAALKNAIAKGWAGVEFDLVLTKDRVPVISHDPWVHQEHCTRADGTALPPAIADRVKIKDVTADELRGGFVCGGVPDPENPNATVVAEPIMTFDEVIAELRTAAPTMLVHLDVKYEPDWTEGPEHFAEQILSRWRAAALPNPWYVTANLPELIRAFEAKSDGGDVPTSLIWPRFPPDSKSQEVAIALSSEGVTSLGFASILQLARDAGADGLCMPYQVAERQAIEAARNTGLKVQLWTLNTPALLARYCQWPLDGIITDMPEAAPCR